ncbi:MAG: hypothetical protein EOP49_02535 [Sphingobacteriales bacterium]|nr:MAG: hypothetical protein EOP49_02535 [Sphingobacteriales bacterium]
MSFIPVTQPLLPEFMDTMLGLGFYRMRQSMFTTQFTYTDDNNLIEVLWTRIRLSDYRPGRRYKALAKRCSRFEITLHKAAITDEIEALYGRYAASMDFDTPKTVKEFLIGEGEADFFPGRMWLVRDKVNLIAVGYFDEGLSSAAGILNFYDPGYHKFSLSKWLYFESVRYAAETGKRYFYPGYIAIGFTKFDYKLEAGLKHIQVWEPDATIWIPYAASMHAPF